MKIYIILIIVFLSIVFSESRSTEERDVDAAVELGLQRVDIGTDEADIDDVGDDYYDDDDEDDDNDNNAGEAPGIDGGKRPARTTDVVYTDANSELNPFEQPSNITNNKPSAANKTTNASSSQPYGILKKIVSKTESLLNKVFPGNATSKPADKPPGQRNDTKANPPPKSPTTPAKKPNPKVRKDVGSSYGAPSADGHNHDFRQPPITAEDKLSLLQIKAAADKIENEIDNIDLENRASAHSGTPSGLKGFLPTKPPATGPDAKPVNPDFSAKYEGYNPYDAASAKLAAPANPQATGEGGKTATADTKKEKLPAAQPLYTKQEKDMMNEILNSDEKPAVKPSNEKDKQNTKPQPNTPAKPSLQIRSASSIENDGTTQENPDSKLIGNPKSLLKATNNTGDNKAGNQPQSGVIQPVTTVVKSSKKANCNELSTHIKLIKDSIDSLHAKLDDMSKKVLETNSDNLNIETTAIQANRDIVLKSEKRTNETIAKYQKKIIKLLNEQKILQKKLVQEINKVINTFITITLGIDDTDINKDNKQNKATLHHEDTHHDSSTVPGKMSDMHKYPNAVKPKNEHTGPPTEAENKKHVSEDKGNGETASLPDHQAKKYGTAYSKQQKYKSTKASTSKSGNSQPLKQSSEPIIKGHQVHPDKTQAKITGSNLGNNEKKNSKAGGGINQGGTHQLPTADSFAKSKQQFTQAHSGGQKPMSVQIETGDVKLADAKSEHMKRNTDDDNELTDEEIDKILAGLIPDDSD